MRHLLDVVVLVISLVLVVTGGAVLFSIPGVGTLVAGIPLVMVGVAFCAMTLTRILTFISGSKLQHRLNLQGINQPDMVVAQ